MDILSDGEQSEKFNIPNVLKQDCVLAPVLLFFTSSNVLCHLPSPWYLHRAPSKWLRVLVTKAKTARDLSLRRCSPTTMPLCGHLLIRKLSTGQYSEASRLVGLTISLGKKEDLRSSLQRKGPQLIVSRASSMAHS